ncbi:MAG: hypothetical protein GC162_19100 [Planctomycetes bacterium]|nr:hypothetical protein [Planctomycetota bacterium]
MVSTADEDVTERVGNIEMRIRFGEPTPESRERWERRSEALAAWLLDRWHEEQRRRAAERN